MSADPPLEPALIDLASPPPEAPGRRWPARLLRQATPGRIAYGVSWLCVLVLVAATFVFANVKGDHLLALKIVLAEVGVLAVVSLHLAAVSLNRRRDVGFSVFAACLIVLFAVPMAAVTATVATAAGLGSVVSDAIGGSIEPGLDSAPGLNPFLEDDEDSSDEETVECLAPDDSVVPVPPEECVDGHYNP
ncbi:hypothetical protein [Actinoplanes sp. NPDC026623]|jgi:hypothetical protein|uniref:hypothetical protein n=1 Tax=Actinoplanes sp. NPDC026623 TaxID=3155610 RepID=UPI0033E23B78